MVIILFILLGLLSGLLAGLLGIGGGVIIVPALYYLLPYFGVGTKVMQIAITTSLAATFITSIVSSWGHYKKHAVHFFAVKWLSFGLLLGCFGGALLGHLIPSEELKVFFGIVLTLISIYFFFPKLPTPRFADIPNRSLFFFGIINGTLSSLLGVGGGIFSMPVLLAYGLAMPVAVGSSSAATLLSTLFGSAAYLLYSPHQIGAAETFGYLNIPAFLAISIASILSAPFGVKLAHTLSILWIRRFFAVALFATGLFMLIHG